MSLNPPKYNDTPLEDVEGLNRAAVGIMKRLGVMTLGQAVALSDKEMEAIDYVGPSFIKIIRAYRDKLPVEPRKVAKKPTPKKEKEKVEVVEEVAAAPEEEPDRPITPHDIATHRSMQEMKAAWDLAVVFSQAIMSKGKSGGGICTAAWQMAEAFVDEANKFSVRRYDKYRDEMKPKVTVTLGVDEDDALESPEDDEEPLGRDDAVMPAGIAPDGGAVALVGADDF